MVGNLADAFMRSMTPKPSDPEFLKGPTWNRLGAIRNLLVSLTHLLATILPRLTGTLDLSLASHCGHGDGQYV